MTELIFRVLFVIIFVLFWFIRIYYVRKTRDPDAPRTREERRAAMMKEGSSGILIVLLTYIEIAVVLLFLFAPPWMAWADLIFPFCLLGIGAVLMLCSIPYMVWVHRTLGQHYSYALETKNEQQLITSGPYGRIRHPLYSAHNLFNLGMIFLTAYIPLIIFAIIGVPLTYARMKDEERMMIERFGSEYEEYLKRTGRIFPKLRV
ncbi:MAG: isoprenylcysteine carboxylmethyltransferase family protein [Candidatus Thorarchaeota archaeon]